MNLVLCDNLKEGCEEGMCSSQSTVLLPEIEKQVGWKEKEPDLSSEHDADQAPRLILFPDLDYSGHGVALSAQQNSACGTVAPRSKTHARRQVLTTESEEKVRDKMAIPLPH